MSGAGPPVLRGGLLPERRLGGQGTAQGRPQAWQLAAESASEVDDWLESLEEVGAVVVAND